MQEIRFNDNELEITLITRSRPQIVRKFLESCYQNIKNINATFSVIDSSDNDETEKAIRAFALYNDKIKYHRLPYETSIAEKYLDAIINSSSKYIWPIGDSTAVDFCEFSRKAYDYIRNDYDLIVNWGTAEGSLEAVDYQDIGALFEKCLWFMTWLGSEIYNRDLYKDIVTEKTKAAILDKTLNECGSWYPQLGILIEALERKDRINVGVVTTDRWSLADIEKKQAWVKDFYQTWCEDLCLLADTCGKNYISMFNKAIRETWTKLGLDKLYWLCRSRYENGLNQEIFDELDRAGYIDRVSDKKEKIKRWAYMSQNKVCFFYGLLRTYKKAITRVKGLKHKFFSKKIESKKFSTIG